VEEVMRYRKKPVIIEAMELKRGYAEMAVNFIGEENIKEYNLGEFAEDSCYIEIKTLEGVTVASEGDFIIKGVKGEFYACKPDIFELTYEKVT